VSRRILPPWHARAHQRWRTGRAREHPALDPEQETGGTKIGERSAQGELNPTKIGERSAQGELNPTKIGERSAQGALNPARGTAAGRRAETPAARPTELNVGGRATASETAETGTCERLARGEPIRREAVEPARDRFAHEAGAAVSEMPPG
jgi:hypothetical protein